MSATRPVTLTTSSRCRPGMLFLVVAIVRAHRATLPLVVCGRRGGRERGNAVVGLGPRKNRRVCMPCQGSSSAGTRFSFELVPTNGRNDLCTNPTAQKSKRYIVVLNVSPSVRLTRQFGGGQRPSAASPSPTNDRVITQARAATSAQGDTSLSHTRRLDATRHSHSL